MAKLRENAGQRRTDFKTELIVVFAILVSLGFPGTLERVYGEQFGLTIEYAAFFLEIFIMLFSGGKPLASVTGVHSRETLLHMLKQIEQEEHADERDH